MKNTIKNFLTFGLYNKVCEVEKKSTSYYSELKRSIEDLDIDSQVEDEINRRNVLTEDNFDPYNYDLVSQNDYNFDSFITEDDSVGEQDVERIVREYLEDYHNAQEMDEAIKENIKDAQSELIESMVKKVCTEMLVDWCQRTAEAAEKQEETNSSSE